MDFSFDQRTAELRDQLLAFMDQHVYPAETALAGEAAGAGAADHWSRPPVVRELQRAAKAQGLWNLFLPGEYGAGLTNQSSTHRSPRSSAAARASGRRR